MVNMENEGEQKERKREDTGGRRWKSKEGIFARDEVYGVCVKPFVCLYNIYIYR